MSCVCVWVDGRLLPVIVSLTVWVSCSPLSSESVGERMGMERVLYYEVFVINVMTMAMIIIVIKLIITRVIILFVDNGRDHLDASDPYSWITQVFYSYSIVK